MKKTSMILSGMALIAAATLGVTTIASAQNTVVSQAVSAGVVGETASGYLGFAQTPSDELRSQVDAINLARRSAFADLAQQRGVTRQQVAAETACSRLSSINQGGAYQLQDGVWRTRGATPIPTPGYC